MQGIGQSFYFGVFPPLTSTGEAGAARIFVAFGVGAVLGSYACGKAYDRWGWKPLVITHVIVCLLNLGAVAYEVENISTIDGFTLKVLFVINGFWFGVHDTVCVSVSNMTMVEVFPTVANQAFSVYGIVFASSAAVGYVLSTTFDYRTMAAVTVGTLIIAVAAKIVLHAVLLPQEPTGVPSQSELDMLSSETKLSVAAASGSSVLDIVQVADAYAVNAMNLQYGCVSSSNNTPEDTELCETIGEQQQSEGVHCGSST